MVAAPCAAPVAPTWLDAAASVIPYPLRVVGLVPISENVYEGLTEAFAHVYTSLAGRLVGIVPRVLSPRIY